jgi:phage repressor protein C with HTH and peptisase S24 domain
MQDIRRQRLKEMIEYLKENRKIFNNADFAKILGKTPSYISETLNGKREISEQFIRYIGDKFRFINTEWLLGVSQDMIVQLSNTMIYDGGGQEQPKYKTVPLLPIDAVAGFPSEDIMGINYADCEQYRVPEFEMSGCEFIIRVSGSSMYPKYSNGDLLACKKIQAITFFQWGKVYVLDTVQGALVKRLFEDKENPDNIICQSDNKENYPAFSLPKNEIRSLSIVLGVIRME